MKKTPLWDQHRDVKIIPGIARNAKGGSGIILGGSSNLAIGGNIFLKSGFSQFKNKIKSTIKVKVTISSF